MRVVPADVLTPIGAYRALASPGAACLLESVESGGRISRYSFIGLDYLAAAEFEANAELYPRVRAFVAEHRIVSPGGALGGALLAFRTMPRGPMRVCRLESSRNRRCREPTWRFRQRG